MPQFIFLVNWTDQGIRNVKDTIQRGKQYSELVGQMGGRVQSTLWTMGRYDVVATYEAPDAATATAIAAKIGSLGNARTETLRAFTAEEMTGILGKL